MESSPKKSKSRRRNKKDSRAPSDEASTPRAHSPRRQHKEDRSNAVAGPSNHSRPRRRESPRSEDVLDYDNGGWGGSSKTNEVTSWSGDFTTGDDFIAFEPSFDEGEDLPAQPVREWDRGKPRNWDRADDRAKRKRGDDYDVNDGYANKKQRVNAAARKAPWAQDVDWESCTNVAEMLQREVTAFVDYISPTPIEHEVRTMTIHHISKAVRRQYPDAQVLPFGSFETKLYLPLGDIDLVIQSDEMAYCDKVSTLKTLANIVRRAGITDQVTIVAKAKVPIIKFVTTHGRLAVDISINQANGIAAGIMVNRFLDEMPALRGLILVTKSFLNQRSMNEVFSGGLGSYSIVCLAVSFLQMHPKIRRGEIDPSRNLGVLVMEFFELYGRYFNYEKTGISIREGGSYFSKARRGWLDDRKPHLLSIEDPGDISNDISRGSFSIKNVRQTFAGAFEIMTTAAYLRAGILSSRRQGQYVNLRHRGHDRLDPEEMSILSSVMGVTQETINHRRLVREVFDKGTLHHIVGVPKPDAVSTNGMTNGRHDSSSSRQSGRSNRSAEAESVLEAYGEADMDMSSEEERDSRRHRRDEIESRYDINSDRRDKKRRRTSKSPEVASAVYTADEDDDDEHYHHHRKDKRDNFSKYYGLQDNGSLDEEEDEYGLIVTKAEDARLEALGTSKSESRSDTIDRRRKYWASKASFSREGDLAE
ncbi:hypothetical protein BD410DRAFT_826904 [Rickenella mellea]|uniref:polynucleotide adenylyltransferase n=1 Tax=Rickenella mellea TaxID=50990 RepID=A0A4Y7QBD3_9AGAM|nr:hypothetical protein BD410DRAFT_826904 [Rickenella mellea]